MNVIAKESAWSHAGLTRMVRTLSEEQRLIFGWMAGLVLAGTGLLPPSHFLCLSCCCSVEEKGAERSCEGRPVCPQCKEPAHPHVCLSPVRDEWTGWHAFSKNANPDFEAPFYYQTLAETVRTIFTDEGLKAAPDGAFGLLRDLVDRRHIQDIIPLLGRLCLELRDEQREAAVQRALCHLFGAFCLAAQLPSIASIACGRYRDARAALAVAAQAKKAAWSDYRGRYERLSARCDGGMEQVITQRAEQCRVLSQRLDLASTASHAVRLQRASRQLNGLTEFRVYKKRLYRALGRITASYRKDLAHHIGEILASCHHVPTHAVARLSELMDNRTLPTRLVDDQLVHGWIEGGGNGASMVAARAAEHLALGWVRGWVPVSDDVQDMSRLQIENPQDRRWIQGDISRIEAEGGQEIFYDVKNTYVRAGRYSHLGVRHKHPGKTTGISYIGTLTRADDRTVWRTEDDARRSSVPLSVTGIYNEHVVKAVKAFAADTTPCVAVEPVDLWGADIEGRDNTRVPAFLFVMPRAAWNPFRATGARKRFLACLNEHVPKDILKVFVTEDTFITAEGKTSFSVRIEALLREALVTGRAPQLPFVYCTVLDALVAQFNDQIKGVSWGSVQVFLRETEQIFFGEGYTMPLGAWDPSESLRLVMQAFRMFLETRRGGQKTDNLPTLTRIEISKAGTIFARTAKGERLTLVSRCDKKYPVGQKPPRYSLGQSQTCKSWPLIFGNDNGQVFGLPAAYSCGKCGRLLCNKGHGCPGADPDDPTCLWNIKRNGLTV